MPRAARTVRLRLIALLAIAAASGCAGTGADRRAPAPPEPTLLSGAHQLTFAGRRSGEGYFSRDGRRMVFQSEREPGNPFYQIYLLDLVTGELTRLSPGVGKTTCAYFHPGGSRVIFSSTHLDPEARAKQAAEIAARESGEERRYAWDYDPHYDVFAMSLAGPDASDTDAAAPRRLTEAYGYDAEASWSPDGRLIVFASNRHAYAPDADIDRVRLEEDPAYYVDLYVMDANGRNVRRLTDTPGYDGGPFFSPDGQHIVWRRFSENGALAEIHTMRADGTGQQAITDLGAMSWAPFYHPSGDYVVFTTNRHGYDDFELYVVDAAGAAEPVRASELPGFDGLPVFSPDGRELVWTSNRTASGRSQLFRARWDDGLARERLGLPDPADAVVAPLLPLPEPTDPAITEADLRAHVAALASETTEGRLTGTPGERIATSYVARVFRALGLEPAGENGTFFQPFGFTGGISLGEGNALRVVRPDGSEGPVGEEPVVDVDWRPFAFSAEGDVPPSDVVFAGYGIVAPAAEGQRAVDAYADLDVEDRWVLVLRFIPEGLPPESRRHLHRYASLRHKAMVARDRGARGLLVVSGPRSKVREELAPLQFDVSLAGSSVAAVSITDALAERLLAPGGRDLGALQDAADADSASPGFVLEDVRVGATIALEALRQTGRNVLARLQVGPEPSADAVVVGAHVDHLGRGAGSGSLARPEEAGEIHPGADDNASGVAALIEVAQRLASRQQAGDLDARRDVLFAAWSGEELGLLGSSHFAAALAGDDEPIDPHAAAAGYAAMAGTGGPHGGGDPHAPQTGAGDPEGAADPHARGSAPGSLADRFVAYLNMDMVGRLEDELSLFGVGSSPLWPRLIEQENVALRLPIAPQDDSYLPTDATVFYTRRVPILAAFTGAHGEYHTPRDTPDTLDYAHMRDIARFMAGVTQTLAAREEAPEYVATAPDPRSGGPGAMRVYLGTIPDYAQSDVPGVMLSGVSAAGPAEEAGIRGGDVIVRVAERDVENIYDYTYALEALSVGEPVTITVLRNGRRLELEVVPASRQ